MDYRQYDNATGRFNGIDALAEMQYSQTPYHFGYGNPVFWADPSGLLSESFLQSIWDNSNNSSGVTTWHNNNGMFTTGSSSSYTGNIGVDGDDGTFFDNLFDPVTVVSGSSNAGGTIQSHVYANGRFYTNNSQKAGYFSGGSNLISDIYNSTLGRYLLPDFINIGIGFSGIAGVGGSTSIELNWITHGPEASFLPAITTTQSIGAGFSIDATINIGTARYLGSANDINRSMLSTDFRSGGIGYWGSGGLTAGGKIGATGSYTPTTTGYGVIGTQLNIGGGIPLGPLPANGAGGVSNTFILHDFYGN